VDGEERQEQQMKRKMHRKAANAIFIINGLIQFNSVYSVPEIHIW
jgi:hypothetical protein